jgi:stage 0 sporulation regulatory protein
VYTNETVSSEMLEAIKMKRELMITCANKKGFTSEETIKYSQELDVLINEYHKVSSQSLEPKEEVRFAFNQMVMIWPKVFV